MILNFSLPGFDVIIYTDLLWILDSFFMNYSLIICIYLYQVEMAGVSTDFNDSPSTGSRVDQWIKQQQEDQVDNNFIIHVLVVDIVGEVEIWYMQYSLFVFKNFRMIHEP